MKYELTQDAKRRLERVARLIEEEPLRINMAAWNYADHLPTLNPRPACNTVGCIAGWIVADNRRQIRVQQGLDPYPPEGLLLPDEQWDVIPNTAAELLGIAEEDWLGDYVLPQLFCPTDWPDKFRSEDVIRYGGGQYDLRGGHKPGTPEYAAVVAERIRYFIEFGE